MRKFLITLMCGLLATISVAEGREITQEAHQTAYQIPLQTPWKTTVVMPGWTQVGLTSFYGIGDGSGKFTASGARFNAGALTAAHAWLPFGTVLRVTVLDTGVSRNVVINDRVGPAVARGHRILDLSDGAARALGFHQQGVTRVRIEVLSNPKLRLPA